MRIPEGRIGSWEGKDVLHVTKDEYDNGDTIKPTRFIYAVDNLIGDGNTYLVRNNVVFAQLLNEHGDINMIENRNYYRPMKANIPPKEEQKIKFNNAEGEFVFKKETVTFNKDVIPKGTSKDMDRGKRAANKTVDDWIGFGMNATVEEILKGKK